MDGDLVARAFFRACRPTCHAARSGHCRGPYYLVHGTWVRLAPSQSPISVARTPSARNKPRRSPIRGCATRLSLDGSRDRRPLGHIVRHPSSRIAATQHEEHRLPDVSALRNDIECHPVPARRSVAPISSTPPRSQPMERLSGCLSCNALFLSCSAFSHSSLFFLGSFPQANTLLLDLGVETERDNRPLGSIE
jgi:hypothetical protein